MTKRPLGEIIAEMTHLHEVRIDQLTNLGSNSGGPEIFELAERVIGPGVSAAFWLTSAQIGLNGAVPAVLALDLEGHEEVKAFLTQIEHGVIV